MPSRWQQLLDTGADRLIVPGYSRLGYALRRRWWSPDPPADALAGEVVLVTGANSGLGKATATGLGRLGADVHLLVRDERRGEVARAQIAAEAGIPTGRLTLEVCDVSDLESVAAFAQSFGTRCRRLRAVVHNAGVMPPQRSQSRQGHELALATHVLGPHLLTRLLADQLTAGRGRVVWMSSGGMYAQRLPSADWQYEQGPYRPATAYARTKRMQVVLAQLWARRSADLFVAAMHPGWADTAGVVASMPRFHLITRPVLRTAEQGADTAVWLVGGPAQRTGLFWHDRAPRPTHYTRRTRESEAERNALWELCEQLTS